MNDFPLKRVMVPTPKGEAKEVLDLRDQIEGRKLPEAVTVPVDRADRIRDLRNRFHYHPPRNQTEIDQHTTVRDVLYEAAVVLNDIVPPSAERELALRDLERAMFWANAGLARGRS